MKPFCVFGSVYVSPVDLGLAYYSYFVRTSYGKQKIKSQKKRSEVEELQAIFTYLFLFYIENVLNPRISFLTEMKKNFLWLCL